MNKTINRFFSLRGNDWSLWDLRNMELAEWQKIMSQIVMERAPGTRHSFLYLTPLSIPPAVLSPNQNSRRSYIVYVGLQHKAVHIFSL